MYKAVNIIILHTIMLCIEGVWMPMLVFRRWEETVVH